MKLPQRHVRGPFLLVVLVFLSLAFLWHPARADVGPVTFVLTASHQPWRNSTWYLEEGIWEGVVAVSGSGVHLVVYNQSGYVYGTQLNLTRFVFGVDKSSFYNFWFELTCRAQGSCHSGSIAQVTFQLRPYVSPPSESPCVTGPAICYPQPQPQPTAPPISGTDNSQLWVGIIAVLAATAIVGVSLFYTRLLVFPRSSA